MVGRFGARSRLNEGENIEVAVDTRALHFFDPETGLGIYDDDVHGGRSMSRRLLLILSLLVLLVPVAAAGVAGDDDETEGAATGARRPAAARPARSR